MMSPKFKSLLLLSGIILLTVIVIFLSLKILGLNSSRLYDKYISSDISRSVVFENIGGDLKYFYEYESDQKVQDSPEWLGYTVTYSYNKDSLNERYNYSEEKGTGVFRVITLGDSFTFGLHVNTEENYPEQLEVILNNRLKCKNISKFEVIN